MLHGRVTAKEAKQIQATRCEYRLWFTYTDILLIFCDGDDIFISVPMSKCIYNTTPWHVPMWIISDSNSVSSFSNRLKSVQ